MNRLYKNLEELLNQKIRLYENFVKLLKEEWVFVSKYSYDSLKEITAKKEDQVMQMQALENSRSCLMKKIAEKLKVRQSSLTLKKLIQYKDNPYRNNLARCRNKLLSQLKEVNEWTEKVKNIMDHSALSLNKSMAFIHSTDEKASSPYLANGKVMEGRVEGRMVSMDA